MAPPTPVDCRNCAHFRARPFEARIEGCYLEKNMVSKQKQACLDEQQLPGDHRKINLRGDCPDYRERPRKAAWWRRLWALGA